MKPSSIAGTSSGVANSLTFIDLLCLRMVFLYKPEFTVAFVAITPTLVCGSEVIFSATGFITSITGTRPSTNSNTSCRALAVAVLQAMRIALQLFSNRNFVIFVEYSMIASLDFSPYGRCLVSPK